MRKTRRRRCSLYVTLWSLQTLRKYPVKVFFNKKICAFSGKCVHTQPTNAVIAQTIVKDSTMGLATTWVLGVVAPNVTKLTGIQPWKKGPIRMPLEPVKVIRGWFMRQSIIIAYLIPDGSPTQFTIVWILLIYNMILLEPNLKLHAVLLLIYNSNYF